VISLSTSIDDLPKINRRIIPALKRLGINTLHDLLFHFPVRYDDFSNLKSIRQVRLNETVTIRGKISKIANRRTARKRMVLTEAWVDDDTGRLKVLWFNQPFLVKNIKAGATVNLSGKVVLGPDGIYLQNPVYEKISGSQISSYLPGSRNGLGVSAGGIHTGGLVAVYPETSGITSRWLRYLISQFIELRKELVDSLPEETRRRYQLLEIKEALRAIHFPKNAEEAERAAKRFSFEELLLVQLRALKERIALKEYHAPAIPLNLPLVRECVRSLPYELTSAQRRSMWEIFQDLQKPRPMNRLLEGDVGSGKTVVAAAAALLVAHAGYKTAFMAPTEILARQHYRTLSEVLAPFKIEIGLLVGAEKRVLPETQVIIGTHALIQDNVRLERLGLVVVDEQHRFGVKQRMALTRQNINNHQSTTIPHFLSMSATPIPRTLALTIYGDLDLSILDEMPKNRKPVITIIVEPQKREEAYQFIREEVKKGRQVFVICPRIEPSADSKPSATLRVNEPSQLRWEVRAVKEEYKRLSETVFPDFKIGMLHGKLKSKEKDSLMQRFKNKEIDILVATSVVEVGVDVPNATIMMIEGAERFGLAQLHQFRGRVGRGADQSYCLLFPSEDGLITKRLRALVEAKNGFELAEKDLEIRGPGDIFGTRQWGVPNKIWKALGNAKLVREVRREAMEIIKTDPTLKKYPALLVRLGESYQTMHLE